MFICFSGYDATLAVLKNNNLGHVEMSEEIYHAHCIYPTPDRLVFPPFHTTFPPIILSKKHPKKKKNLFSNSNNPPLPTTRLARHAGLDPESKEFKTLGNNLAQQFNTHYISLVSPETAPFYPSILLLLSKIPSHIKIGALTNACREYGVVVLSCNCCGELYGRFGCVHGADSVPAAKPAPGFFFFFFFCYLFIIIIIFILYILFHFLFNSFSFQDGILQCIKELKITQKTEKHNKNIIYIGDSIGDGKAAKAANTISIGVTWGSTSEKKMREEGVFDYIVGSVEELGVLLVGEGWREGIEKKRKQQKQPTP